MTPEATLAEARRRLAELEAAERRYRQLIEGLPLAVYRDLPDESATSEYISPRVEEIFGYPRERRGWILRSSRPSSTPTTVTRPIAGHAAALARGDEHWSFEYRLIAADGRTVFVRDDAWIAKGEDGEPTHVQGFMIDITDQALAHAELDRQKQYFESLVEISPVAIVVMDADQRVTGWNPAAAELFGYSPDEAIGRLIDDLVLDGDLRGEGRDVTREALEAGRAAPDHSPLRERTETLVDVQMMLVPLKRRRRARRLPRDLPRHHRVPARAGARRDAARRDAGAREDAEPRDTFETILGELQRVVPYDSCSVQVIQGNRLVIVGGRGLEDLGGMIGVGFDLDDETNLGIQVVRSKRRQVFADVSDNPHFASQQHGGDAFADGSARR